MRSTWTRAALSAVALFALSCGRAAAPPVSEVVEEVPPQASPCEFRKVLELEGTEAEVSVPPGETCAAGTFRIHAVAPGGVPQRMERHRDGEIVDAWLVDLENDGTQDILIATRSSGGGSFGGILWFETRVGEFVERPVADLDDEQRRPYRGQDTFRVAGGVLYRSFPAYRPGDVLGEPGGGTVEYRFQPSGNRWAASGP